MDAWKPFLGLIVFTTIPVVMFALWVEYFREYLERRRESPEEFEDEEGLGVDYQAEASRVRLAGFCVSLAQLIIFFATSSLRAVNPLAALALFVTALIVQNRLQAHAESAILPSATEDPLVAKTAQDRAKDEMSQMREKAEFFHVFTRTLFWSLVAGAIYSFCVLLCTAIAFLVCRSTSVSDGAAMLILMSGCLTGVLMGLGINFALGAVLLKQMLPCKPMEDGEIRTLLEACFSRAGVPVPGIWTLELERVRFGNALIAGFSFGKGWFRPGVFISRSLIETLSSVELQAVVLHEVSHLRLRHLAKRFGLSVGLVGAVGFIASALMIVLHMVLPGAPVGGIAPMAAFAGFGLAFYLIKEQSRKHEKEADRYAVGTLGADLDAFSNALRKIDLINQSGDVRSGRSLIARRMSGHPATEERIAELSRDFDKLRDKNHKDQQNKAA